MKFTFLVSECSEISTESMKTSIINAGIVWITSVLQWNCFANVLHNAVDVHFETVTQPIRMAICVSGVDVILGAKLFSVKKAVCWNSCCWLCQQKWSREKVPTANHDGVQQQNDSMYWKYQYKQLLRNFHFSLHLFWLFLTHSFYCGFRIDSCPSFGIVTATNSQ